MDKKPYWYGLHPAVYSFIDEFPQEEMDSICNLITETVIFIEKYLDCQYYPVPTYIVKEEGIRLIKALVKVFNGEFNEFEEYQELRPFKCLDLILLRWFGDYIFYDFHYSSKELVRFVQDEKEIYEFLEDPYSYFIHLKETIEKLKVLIIESDDIKKFLFLLEAFISQLEIPTTPCDSFFRDLAKELEKYKEIEEFLHRDVLNQDYFSKKDFKVGFMILEIFIDEILKQFNRHILEIVKPVREESEDHDYILVDNGSIPFWGEIIGKYGCFVPPGFWEKYSELIPFIKKKMGIPSNINIPLKPCVFIYSKAIRVYLNAKLAQEGAIEYILSLYDDDIDNEFEDLFNRYLQLTIIHEHAHAALRHGIVSTKIDLKDSYDNQLKLDKIRHKHRYIEEGLAEYITYEFVSQNIRYVKDFLLEIIETYCRSLNRLKKIMDPTKGNESLEYYINSYLMQWPYCYMFIWKSEIKKGVNIKDIITEWKINPEALIKRYPLDKINDLIEVWIGNLKIIFDFRR